MIILQPAKTLSETIELLTKVFTALVFIKLVLYFEFHFRAHADTNQ